MNIADLKFEAFDTGSLRYDDYYTILEHFGFLDKLDLIKEKYKENTLRDLIDFSELAIKGHELGWADGSRIILNLRNVLNKDEAAALIWSAGSMCELEDEIYAIYLESALKEIAEYLIERE